MMIYLSSFVSAIGEFSSDANTVALYHLNNDFNDSSDNEFNLTANGNASLVANNISTAWMSSPSGKSMKLLGLGDKATVNIPDSLIQPSSSATPFTIEAQIYPIDYKAYSIGNYHVVLLEQNWDSSMGVSDGIWNSPANPSVAASNVLVVSDDTWNANVDINQWHALRMTYDDGVVNVYVDETLIGTANASMHPSRTNDWALTLGNFEGYIDEVRISDVVRTGDTTAPSTTQNLSGNAVNQTSINLTWSASTDTESGIDHYNVYRNNVNIGEA